MAAHILFSCWANERRHLRKFSRIYEITEDEFTSQKTRNSKDYGLINKHEATNKQTSNSCPH